jgi:hypothetical protein
VCVGGLIDHAAADSNNLWSGLCQSYGLSFIWRTSVHIRPMVLCSITASLVLLVVVASRAEDSGLAKELTEKGAKLTETQGIITGLDLPNLAKWSEDDFKKIGQLAHLQKLSFGAGLTDHHLSLLIHLPEVTTFTTNGSQLDDDGVRQLANFKNLTVLTFFHPGKEFTGVGLADLTVLPKLESLTVGGSSVFGNEGLSAIAKLSHLKGLRIWHCNADSQGLACLKDLQDLRSITVGQRLSNKPPTLLDDNALAILASMKSLESVSLMEARLSLSALSKLKQLPALTRLTLGGIDIPESDVAKLKAELPRAQIKWTAPTPVEMKRIEALFWPEAVTCAQTGRIRKPIPEDSLCRAHC